MVWQSPSDYQLVTQEIAPVSTSAAVNGTGVDLAGWDGVMFVLNIGVMTATGTVDFKANGATDSGFSVAVADVATAALVQIVAASGGSKVYILDVKTSTVNKRFCRAILTAATAASVVSVTAHRYRAGRPTPPTQSATQIVSV